MSRYTRILPYNGNPARLFDTISKYLIMEGYTCQQINYENVFKKGNGILSDPTYIKISAAPGQVTRVAVVLLVVRRRVHGKRHQVLGVVENRPENHRDSILQLLLTHLLQRAKLLPPPVISAYMYSLFSPLVG